MKKEAYIEKMFRLLAESVKKNESRTLGYLRTKDEIIQDLERGMSSNKMFDLNTQIRMTFREVCFLEYGWTATCEERADSDFFDELYYAAEQQLGRYVDSVEKLDRFYTVIEKYNLTTIVSTIAIHSWELIVAGIFFLFALVMAFESRNLFLIFSVLLIMVICAVAYFLFSKYQPIQYAKHGWLYDIRRRFMDITDNDDYFNVMLYMAAGVVVLLAVYRFLM